MISQAIIETIDRFLSNWNQSEFNKILMGLREAHQDYSRAFLDAFEANAESDVTLSMVENLFDYSQLTHLHELIRVTPRVLFRASAEFDVIYQDLFDNGLVTTTVDEVRIRLKAFEDTFANYRGEPKNATALLMWLSASAEVFGWLDTVEEILTSVRNSLQSSIALPLRSLDVKRLSLLLERRPSLEEFGTKLVTLNVIYVELAHLLDVPLIDNPPSIAKIESGSFWADILGYPKIIDFMEKIIENATAFLYRKFTSEGKIASIPRRVEAIDSVLQLRKQLSELGIDTTQLDDNLNKSAVIIAKNLNYLLSREAKVKVNDKTFSVGEDLMQKYLEQRNVLLLPVTVQVQIDESNNDDVGESSE